MIGTKLAHYEITSHIGSGGMGEVYQATDAKLGRSVAVKFLPESFAHDADRVARFEREARVLASLNHPNIAAIYGLEDANDKKFLVMELVLGETLADRIKRGAIPLDVSLAIAKQIAEALEAAHEKGIIHRDLKPSNIKVTPEGLVKVLDFGLAKAISDGTAACDLSNSPTMTAATRAGVILGTPTYMSPEQARGMGVDKRTDIWAFGCVLYEMLTGKRAFPGDDESDTLAGILRGAPDWSALPATAPAAIRRLLRRSLEKDRKRRLPDCADARIEIEDALATGASDLYEAPVPVSRSTYRYALAWFAAGALFVALLAAVVSNVTRESSKGSAIIRTAIMLGDDQDLDLGFRSYPLALSPDGARLVYVAERASSPARRARGAMYLEKPTCPPGHVQRLFRP